MKKENFLVKIIQYGIYLSLFVPLVVTPKTIYPFLFGRVLVLQAIIGVLLGIWLILIYLYPKYKPRVTPILIVLLVYFSIFLISSFLGVDFGRSFWGNEERMGGFFTLFHFFLLFLIARSVFSGWRDWKRVFCVSLVVSVIVCIIALAQRQGYVSLWGVLEDGRVSGTIGNSIFFAGYLLFHIFLSSLLVLKEKTLQYKIPLIVAGLINLFTFLLAQTRGAYIALIATVFLVFLSYVFLSKNKRVKILISAMILISILASLFIWFNRSSSWAKQYPGLDRMINFSIKKETTVQTRFMTWGAAMNAWKERPILGWGLDNFHIGFNKYYNPKLLNYSIFETWFDRAHNVVFDQLVMGGLLGLTAYLSIFIVSIYMLYKFFRQKIIDKHIFILVSAVLIAYFIQNLFAFDSPSALLVFFLCLAFIDSLKDQTQRTGVRRRVISILIPIFLFIPIISVLFNFQIYKASAQSMRAVIQRQLPLEARVELYEDALEISTPYKEETRSELTQIILQIFIDEYFPADQARFYFDKAEAAALKNIDEHPSHTFYYFILGRLYAEMSGYDLSYIIDSEIMFDKALELSPKRQQIYYGLGKLYLLHKQWDKAIGALNKMVELDPEGRDAHWFLGIALLMSGENEEGYKEIRKARKFGYYPKTTDDISVIVATLLEKEDYDEMIIIYEDFVLVERDTKIIPPADFCAKVAVIYAKRGERERAREAALRAADIDPSFAEEAEVFIKMLGLE